ncbi:MAG TPA: SCO6880 family protein [Nakamurella sp.]|nr:SCO6880 family protein [Nakamurella sp.]
MTATEASSFTHFRSARPAPPLAGLGVVGMLLGFVAVVISIGLAYGVNVVAGLVFALLSSVALMSIAVRDRHGSSWVERTGIRVAHLYATRTGATLHQGGPVSRLGTYRLPGVLADTDLTEHEDAQGNPFGLVHTPRSNHYAVTIEAHPDGASLIDADDQVANIDRWGRWLDFLAVEPGILQVQVTIETAPDDGHGLRSEIESTMSADAPDLARKVLGEIADTYPTGSATVRSWVTLTFDGTTAKRTRDADAMGAALAPRLPEIVGKLAGTGAGACTLVDGQALCEAVRVAYDPASSPMFAAAAAGGHQVMLRWSAIGPPAADNRWDYYRHASGVSVSWAMTSILGAVNAEGLGPILRPHPAITRKRVALLFELRDAGKAPGVAAADVRASEARAAGKRKPSASDRRDVESALVTADEEAHGHSLVDVAVIVTATVRDLDDLPAAEAAIDMLGPASRLQLRRENGAHAAAFAQGLPGVGLITAAHSVIPRPLRESL